MSIKESYNNRIPVKKNQSNFVKSLETFFGYVIQTNFMNENKKKVIKFHGTEVENIRIHFLQSQNKNPNTNVIEEFNALNSSENCETLNIQVVADFVTITFYQNESANIVLKRELIPTHTVEHIWIDDLIKGEINS